MPKFNPFRPGSAISPGMFCGRLNEIETIEKALFQTKYGNPAHFLIEGERGIGKTSLLLYLDWVARGKIKAYGESLNFLVVNVSLREGMGQDDIINCILECMRREVAATEGFKDLCRKTWAFLSRVEIAGCSIDTTSRESSTKLDELTNTLVDLATEAAEKIDGVLILLDEADRPAASAKLGETCKLVTERLTQKGCERICFGVAGLPGLVGTLRESHESSPRLFSILPLEPLEPKEREQVVNRGLDEAAKPNQVRAAVTPEALEMLADLSEGYPHFLQEFCFHAFKVDKNNIIGADDVLHGAFSENGAIDQLGEKYYSDMYIEQIGSEDYRKVLMCMAESLDEWVERQHLVDQSGVRGTIVDNALRALKDRGIIIANPRVRGQYRLPTKAFAIWIKAKESAPAPALATLQPA